MSNIFLSSGARPEPVEGLTMNGNTSILIEILWTRMRGHAFTVVQDSQIKDLRLSY
jgi:hypothetical protein